MREWRKSSPGHNVSCSLIKVVIRGTLPVYQMYISFSKLQPSIITLFICSLFFVQTFAQEDKLLSRLETLENQLETLTKVTFTGSCTTACFSVVVAILSICGNSVQILVLLLLKVKAKLTLRTSAPYSNNVIFNCQRAQPSEDARLARRQNYRAVRIAEKISSPCKVTFLL